MRPETAIQHEIRKRLEERGYRSVHVPNGAVLAGDSAQRARQMNALKRDGLCVGFPDLLVYADKGRVGHIEVKCESNKQSDTQQAVQAWLGDLGHSYAVCRSADDVDETLKHWGWA